MWVVAAAVQSPDVSTYFAMARQYFAPRTVARACMNSQEAHGWNVSRGAFRTLALEGAGHHQFWDFKDALLTGGYRGGGVLSFPHSGHTRNDEKGRPGQNPSFEQCVKKMGKFIVLVRDPVDSWRSSLARYWTKGSFDREFQLYLHAMEKLSLVVSKMRCDNTLFLPFELLVNEPRVARPVLHVFLGVNPSSRRSFDGWMARLENQSSDVNWPGPYPVDCRDDRCGKLGAKLIEASLKGSDVSWIRSLSKSGACGGSASHMSHTAPQDRSAPVNDADLECYHAFEAAYTHWLYETDEPPLFVREVTPVSRATRTVTTRPPR